MRVLIADHNATLLAAIADTFAGHVDIATATGRDAAVEVLRQRKIDVVVACDKLVDYTGVELLSEVAEYLPSALLVFAASPARLERLESHLGVLGLFSTLTYPIEARKLQPALALARRRLQDGTGASGVRHVVLEDESPAPQQIVPSETAVSKANSPQREAGATADRHGQGSATQAANSQKRPLARTPVVITEAQRAAFQRALAKRNAAKAEERADGRGRSAATGRGERPATRITTTRDVTRRRPPLGSLSELAQMAASGGPSRLTTQGPSRRAALLIGGGILAALAVAALNFEHSGGRDAVQRSRSASSTAPATSYPPQAPSPFAEPEEARNSLAIQGPQQPAPSEESTAVSEPQAAPVNPDTAPPDPPPPPALEQPGPMEPPSSMMPTYSDSAQ